MSTTDAARESARQRNGRFGPQVRSELDPANAGLGGNTGMNIFRMYRGETHPWHMDIWVARRKLITYNQAYQRGSVWTVEARQRLMISLYAGLPVPAIIYALDGNTLTVIDGQQRLRTVLAWWDGEFTVDGDWFGRPGETLDIKGVENAIGSPGLTSSLPLPGIEMDLQSIRDPSTKKLIQLSPEERERLEARLFLLINSGTPQTPEDLARAAACASII